MQTLDQMLTAGRLGLPGSTGPTALPGLDPMDALLSHIIAQQSLSARRSRRAAAAAAPAPSAPPTVPRRKPTVIGGTRPQVRTRTSMMPGGQPEQEDFAPVPRAKPELLAPTGQATPLPPEPDPNMGGANPTYDPERVVQFFRDNPVAPIIYGGGAGGSLIATGTLTPALVGSGAMLALLALMSGFGNTAGLGFGQNPIGS